MEDYDKKCVFITEAEGYVYYVTGSGEEVCYTGCRDDSCPMYPVKC